MTKLKKFNFALVLLAVAIYGGYSLRLHELLLNRVLVLVGGDLSWNIFAIKIGMQGNLDGISEILGWPYGYGLFAEPLLGTGPFYTAMLISKILFIQNIFIVYILTVISGMLTNTIAAYWMVSKEFVDKKYSYLFAFLIGITPFVLMRHIQYTEKSKVVEYSAVNFLEENTKNCGVLQVPVDTFPLIQDFTFSNGDKFGYNQTIPYLLSNNNKWSLYGIPGNKFWQNYKEIPTEITIEAANSYSNQGFCAILFDKDFSQWQIDRQAGLDFTVGNWPGLRMNLGSPDFDNGRYQIYLLNK